MIEWEQSSIRMLPIDNHSIYHARLALPPNFLGALASRHLTYSAILIFAGSGAASVDFAEMGVTGLGAFDMRGLGAVVSIAAAIRPISAAMAAGRFDSRAWSRSGSSASDATSL